LFHFWQRRVESIENTCTFFVQTCLDCQRAWNPALVDEARPICIIPSFYADMAQRHYDDGHPFASDLPEWFPLGCTHHLSK